MSELEEDFLKDLEADLDADLDNPLADDEGQLQLERANEPEHLADKRTKGEEPLLTFIENYTPVPVSSFEHLKPSQIARLAFFEQQISHLISHGANGLSSLLARLNDVSLISQAEISLLHNYMKFLYRPKFPELEDLVPTPLCYADVIYTLERSEANSNTHIATALEQEALLSKEQTLVVAMSMNTSLKREKHLSEERRSLLFESRSLIRTLIGVRDHINNFIKLKVPHVAPNVSALIGPNITALLISHAGGILELAQIPSCNLASIGKSKHLSHELHTNITGVRQEGYIYGCPLIQEQPAQYHKQLLRMVCAKVALAARVDSGAQQASEIEDSLGSKWKSELLDKIQKLQDTTAERNVKPLPVPMDAPKKKRAGRKFRKYKQQFQLSHIRQLQNRVEFGKQEQTVTDDFGEEIGLGMTRTALQNATGSGGVMKRTANNSAKLTKAMKKKIAEANEQSKEYLQSLDHDI